MNKRADSTLKPEILEHAQRWLAEKRPAFVVADEFARHVAATMARDLGPDELLAAVLDCGFPCVRGDKGERVLWLRPTKAAGAATTSFVPTEAIRQFVASASNGEQAA
ncbi:hypothetical protein [Luteolibacter soli]|uniref:Uncharacterized protein n=1 Tax=Luteolibacter soli TaxID=3135280 RepID=A0ABU9B2R1_9BACT